MQSIQHLSTRNSKANVTYIYLSLKVWFFTTHSGYTCMNSIFFIFLLTLFLVSHLQMCKFCIKKRPVFIYSLHLLLPFSMSLFMKIMDVMKGSKTLEKSNILLKILQLLKNNNHLSVIWQR